MSAAYSIGLMNQFGDALEKESFTPAEVTRLKNSGRMRDLLRVVDGHAEIKTIRHIIDLDAPASTKLFRRTMHRGWKIEQHIPGGQFEWNPCNIILYLSNKQKSDQRVFGLDLQSELNGKLVLNANLLDYLLAHPELIPEEWKDRCIFFWGTIYSDENGWRWVRHIYFRTKRWYDGPRCLNHNFFADYSAALLAPPQS